MKFKILEPNKPDDWSFNDDEELYKALGFNCWDDPFIRILAKAPGVRKKDILDYFEYMIFGLCEWFELDGIILGDYTKISQKFQLIRHMRENISE